MRRVSAISRCFEVAITMYFDDRDRRTSMRGTSPGKPTWRSPRKSSTPDLAPDVLYERDRAGLWMQRGSLLDCGWTASQGPVTAVRSALALDRRFGRLPRW